MMPGQSNLKAKVPSYIVLFAALVSLLTQVEVATLKRPGSFWWPFGFGCLWLGWMVWSRRRSEREVPRLVYEDRPMEITQLRLAD
jgi:apolipoprotein N-acyltransferase